MDRDLLTLSDELFERWSGLFREVRQRIADGALSIVEPELPFHGSSGAILKGY